MQSCVQTHGCIIYLWTNNNYINTKYLFPTAMGAAK